MSSTRLVVLISGGGTGLQNLIDRIAKGTLHAEIAHVISSKPGVYGLERAAKVGIPHEVISRKECGSRDSFSQRIFERVRERRGELVCLAGFLEFLPIPNEFTHRVMNIHPSLLPAFGGKGMYGQHVHEAVLAAGVKVSGCTVHFVDNEYDHGPIIVQKPVPVLDDDTPASLADRIFVQEWEAYPEAINLFAAGRLKVEGRRVRIV